MKMPLEKLFNRYTLSRTEAKDILGAISEGVFNSEQISAFLTVFRMRKISTEELDGFRDCLQERCVRVDLSEFDPIDLCGTGGDGKNTFNISTLASFVTAAAGYKVAKHGNYGVSSNCGSSNVLEALGYRFTNDTDVLKRQLDEIGICFLHAPLFHPAMKTVAPVRRNIGIKTFFNMLGPMVNPSAPDKQLVGVFSAELQRYYKYIYERSEKEYRILHSLDGYDEMSLTAPTKVIRPGSEQIVKPADLGVPTLDPDSIKGGDTVASSAKIFLNVLQGKGSSPQNDVVLSNAALAINCYKPEVSYQDCKQEAEEALSSGKALNVFEKLIA